MTQTQHDYGVNEIEILEGLEAVRKRPSMYIGSTCSKGLHHLVYEIVDNSIDEGVAGYCNNIKVTINEDNSITVIDNGRGMPTGIHPKTNKSTVETILTTLHAGGKFGNGGYKISGGLHGVGSSVVNALSEYLKITVCREGKVYEQEYKYGKPLYELKVIGESDTTGTSITFKPDKEIFETTKYNYNTLENRLKELAYLNNNIKISLTDKRGKEEKTNTYYTDKGVAGYLENINQNKATLNDEIIRINKEIENYQIDIALQYLQNDGEIIYTYANNIKTTEGGVHLEGFKNAIRNSINNYAITNNLIKANEKFIGEDVRSGITAIVSVKLPNPQFEGQTKTKLGNAEFKPIVEQMVTDTLDIYLIENPDYARQIVDNALTAKETRIAMKKAKESIKKEKSKNRGSDLPIKLADCSEKDPKLCEVYLVEGDSAGGSAKQGRSREFQAILPLRGKTLNSEKTTFEKIKNCDEIRGLINTIGTGIGKDFDLSKIRYSRIILMQDADVDGDHIKTLLLAFFFRYMRPLIENGHIYIARPPLYKISKGKKIWYTYSDKERDTVLEEVGREGVEIQRYKGLGEMNAEQLWDTTMNPDTRKLFKVGIKDCKQSDYICTLLMGDKVEPRKKYIIENSHLNKRELGGI